VGLGRWWHCLRRRRDAGLFALFKEEFTLPVVAAFLTLIGYSVNDKIVVFDGSGS